MYKLEQMPNVATRISDNVSFSFVDESPFYSEYLAWLAEGNTPEPYIPPVVPVPTTLSMRQARLALLDADLLDNVDDAISSITDEKLKRKAQIEWEFSNEVQRSNVLIQMLSAVMGLSSEMLDQLFTVGLTL